MWMLRLDFSMIFFFFFLSFLSLHDFFFYVCMFVWVDG